jgi:hypothetical protein
MNQAHIATGRDNTCGAVGGLLIRFDREQTGLSGFRWCFGDLGTHCCW